ncbi:MAG: hypothetical protein AB9872_09240 [Solidesulfovibrio sp.]
MRKSRFLGVRRIDSGFVHQALKGLLVYSTALYLFFCSTVFGNFCRHPGRRSFFQVPNPDKERGSTGSHEKLQAPLFDACKTV